MSQVPLTDALLNDRNHEVTAYLDFLKVAIERRAVLTAKDGDLVLHLSQELTHTLKANLGLYAQTLEISRYWDCPQSIPARIASKSIGLRLSRNA